MKSKMLKTGLIRDKFLVFMLIIILSVMLLSWIKVGLLKNEVKKNVQINLFAPLKAAQGALYAWTEHSIAYAHSFVADREVSLLIKELIALPRNKNALAGSNALRKLRVFVKPWLAGHSYLGMFVVAPDGINVASMRDENLGNINILSNHDDVFDKMLKGFPQFILPFQYDVALPGSTGKLVLDQPTIFIGVPVKDYNGSVIAVFMVLLDPALDFTRIIHTARLGETSDIYAFDKSGKLLSGTRFDDQLREFGLIKPNQHLVLSMTLRDPGGNMVKGFRPTMPREALPLIRSVQKAIAGEHGIEHGMDTDGYRDYRGVPVVGAWVWNDELSLGIASEMDVEEAYRSYYSVRKAFVLFVLTVAMLFFIFSLTIIRRKRKGNAVNQQLDKEIGERVKSEQKLKRIFEGIEEAYSKTGMDGKIIQVNHYAGLMLGYESAQELIGKDMPRDFYADSEKRAVLLEVLEKYGKVRNFDLDMKRKDGTIVHCEANVQFVYDDNGKPMAVESIIRDVSYSRKAAEVMEDRRRLAEMLSDIGVALNKDDSLRDILQNCCEILVQGVDAAFARVWLFDEFEEMLVLQASAGMYTRTDGTRSRIRLGDGKVGTIAAKKSSYITNDVINDLMIIDSAWARQEGMVSFAGYPLVLDGRMMGVMALFARHTLSSYRQNSLSTVADNIVLGIYRKISADKMAQMSIVIEQSPMSVLITDLDGTLQYVNQKFCETTGYSVEEAIGQNPRILQSDQHLPEFYKGMWDTLLSGKIWHGEFCNKKKNGDLYWEYASISPVLDKKGEIINFVGIQEDTTERRQAEEQYQKVVQTALDGFWICDTKGCFLEVNDAYCEMIGYSRKELLEMRIPDIEVIELPEMTAAHMEKIVAQGHDTFETQHEHKDGSILDIEINVQYSEIRGGVFIVFVRDITERKRIQEDLTKSKNNLTLALASARAGTMVLDMKKDFLEWNDRSMEIFGVSRETFGNNYESWAKFVHSEDNDTLQPIITEQLKAADFIDIKYRIIRRDGELRNIWAVANIVRDKNKNPIKLSGLQFDITEEIQSAEALKKAKEAAEEATRAKSDFLANMSHEIRTPMNAIVGFGHLALQTELTARQKDYLSKIQFSAKSLLGILNDILDLSKIEAGKLALEPVQFYLDEVLKNISVMTSLTVQQKGLELVFNTDREVPIKLIGDSLRLGQILLNLVNNAIKFTESGEIVVSTDLIGEEAGQVTLKFSVRDTGIGLTRKQIARLFQPFSQADGSTTRKYGGTGLGLSISKQLAELMGGKIALESESGKGSNFFFTAKFIRPSMDEREHRLASIDLKRMQVPDLGQISEKMEAIQGARILLVEDNEINQQVAMELLENAGLVVTAVNNGEKAVQAVVETDYDLVFMDIQMPVMGGYEATGKIRSNPRFEKLPIIAMTANSMSEDSKKSFEAGMNDHVVKPIDLNRLYSVLTEWIKPKKCEIPAHNTPRPVEKYADQDTPLLSDLPGISVSSGLEMVGGNRELYLKLLVKFKNNYVNVIHDIKNAIRDKDKELALQLSHNMKGVSGNIGAKSLFQAAGDLEAAFIQKKSDKLESFLNSFEISLNEVIASIGSLDLNDSGMASEDEIGLDQYRSTAIDVVKVAPILVELAELIEDDITEAWERMDSLKRLLTAPSVRHELKKIEDSMSEYDTDMTLESLERLAKILNISLKGD